MDSWWLANFTTAWFILAPLMIAAYVTRRLLIRSYVWRRAMAAALSLVDPYVTVDIAKRDVVEDDGGGFATRPGMGAVAYSEVKAYLSAACSREARALRAESAADGDGFVLGLRLGEELADEFRGAVLWWSYVEAKEAAGGGNVREGELVRRPCHRLTFHRRHRQLVVDEYLPHVRRRGREALFLNRRRRLYTNNILSDYALSSDPVWSYIELKHPATFDTLAMDAAKKKEIMDDLDTFRSRPWKRGYLLHGPPGTGKSTAVAAMANHLNYDIYDVELAAVRHDHDLRRLLAETTDRSVVVIALDAAGKRGAGALLGSCNYCNDGKRRRSRVTLPGLLNFVDGLWLSCCGDGGERVVVFTTSDHADKLDPALLRRGRIMDMRVEMSYCGFEAFRTLARNYLGVDEHPLFDAVGELLREAQITPADVAECLMASTRAGRGVEASLEHLIEEVKKAKAKAEAAAVAAAGADNSAGEKKGRRRRNRRKKQGLFGYSFQPSKPYFSLASNLHQSSYQASHQSVNNPDDAAWQ